MLRAAFCVMRGTITTTLLNFRATPAERGTIQRAAQVGSMSMSDVMRMAALEYAAKKLEGTQR